MGDGQFLEIVILAMLAGFIFLRLRSVLGRRTGNEKPPGGIFSRRRELEDKKTEKSEKVVRLPQRGREADAGTAFADGDTALAVGLTQIQVADSSFDPASFLSGAKIAFEMIVTSFANRDLDTLRPMVNDEVFRNFSDAIKAYDAKGETAETTLLAIKAAEVVEAGMSGKIAEVTVKFVSEMVTIVRDKDGAILSGDSRSPQTVTDLWTFARSTASSDPNWTLIATRNPN
jgi:predicted lipid-binding transport protein (Tim44 family)